MSVTLSLFVTDICAFSQPPKTGATGWPPAGHWLATGWLLASQLSGSGYIGSEDLFTLQYKHTREKRKLMYQGKPGLFMITMSKNE